MANPDHAGIGGQGRQCRVNGGKPGRQHVAIGSARRQHREAGCQHCQARRLQPGDKTAVPDRVTTAPGRQQDMRSAGYSHSIVHIYCNQLILFGLLLSLVAAVRPNARQLATLLKSLTKSARKFFRSSKVYRDLFQP
jgi:hypothetical protein